MTPDEALSRVLAHLHLPQLGALDRERAARLADLATPPCEGLGGPVRASATSAPCPTCPLLHKALDALLGAARDVLQGPPEDGFEVGGVLSVLSMAVNAAERALLAADDAGGTP